MRQLPLLLFSNKGRVYRIKCYDIPEAGRTARGVAAVNFLSISGDERITACIYMKGKREKGFLTMVTRDGIIKKTDISEFTNIRTNGLLAISLQEGDALIEVKKSSGKDDIILGTEGGQLIRFHETDVRATGRSSMGVRGITLAKGDIVINAALASEGTDVLAVTQLGMGKRTDLSEFKIQGRGGKGVLYYNIKEKTGKVIAFRVVNANREIMLLTSASIAIRLVCSGISQIGRVTSGVKLIDLDEGATVVSVAIVPDDKAIEETPEEAIENMDFEQETLDFDDDADASEEKE